MGRFRNIVLWVMQRNRLMSGRGGKRPKRGVSIDDEASFKKVPFCEDVWWEPSHEEIMMIRASWSSNGDFQEQVGQSVYEFIFETAVDAQKLFPALHKAGKNWRGSLAFKQQSHKFVHVIDQTVNMLHRSEQLTDYLHSVGASHVRYTERGFRAHFWEIFKVAIHEAMKQQLDAATYVSIPDEFKTEALALWDHLAVYMTRRMFAGFCTALVAYRKQQMAIEPATPKIIRRLQKMHEAEERARNQDTAIFDAFAQQNSHLCPVGHSTQQQQQPVQP